MSSLSTRIWLGFLALTLVFGGASLLAVRRLHAIREDLTVIHRGWLALGTAATQARTQHETADAWVARAMTGADVDVQRRLLVLREQSPVSLSARLDEMEGLARQLSATRLREDDARFLSRFEDELRSIRDKDALYDAATQRLIAGEGDDTAALSAVQRDAAQQLGEALRSLAAGVDGKVRDAVRRAEQDERQALYAVVVLSVLAALVGLAVVAWMVRGLAPLRVLVDAAKRIGRGSLEDVQVPVRAAADDEIGALSREWNAMAKALRDRERVLAARTQDLQRLSGFADDVIRSVRVGIVVVDAAGAVRTLNPAARSIFGLPLVDVDGRDLRGLVPAELLPPLAPLLDAIDEVRSSGDIRTFPLVALAARVVDAALVPIRDKAGTSQGDVLLLGEDVTAREETRERLLQSERLAAIGRLAAQITHEIRNPLSSVALNIELLGDDVQHLPTARQAEARAILGAVGNEVERLKQITEGYLRFARLPAPRPHKGDVGDLLADLVAFSQADAAQAGVMLELNVEGTLPAVPYDPQRLRQALLNLLRNGVEAAGRGGTVRVGARATAEGARVSVEDTGPGIADEVKARLFEGFFTTKPQGTGLGLVLTKEIVDEHRGHLHVERSATLGGAAFVVDLPA